MTDYESKELKTLVIWTRSILLLLTIIATSVGSCSYDKRNTLKELVAGGADPMEATCAIYKGEYSDDVCSLLLLKSLGLRIAPKD